MHKVLKNKNIGHSISKLHWEKDDRTIVGVKVYQYTSWLYNGKFIIKGQKNLPKYVYYEIWRPVFYSAFINYYFIRLRVDTLLNPRNLLKR
jgi:hypothetical protein